MKNLSMVLVLVRLVPGMWSRTPGLAGTRDVEMDSQGSLARVDKPQVPVNKPVNCKQSVYWEKVIHGRSWREEREIRRCNYILISKNAKGLKEQGFCLVS